MQLAAPLLCSCVFWWWKIRGKMLSRPCMDRDHRSGDYYRWRRLSILHRVSEISWWFRRSIDHSVAEAPARAQGINKLMSFHNYFIIPISAVCQIIVTDSLQAPGTMVGHATSTLDLWLTSFSLLWYAFHACPLAWQASLPPHQSVTHVTTVALVEPKTSNQSITVVLARLQFPSTFLLPLLGFIPL